MCPSMVGQMLSIVDGVVWQDLYQEERFASTRVAVASRCDEPAWGRECLQKYMVQETKNAKQDHLFDAYHPKNHI